MTEEQQIIYDAVMEALQSHAVKIEDLTLVNDLPDTAYLELSGGRKMSLSKFIDAVGSSIVGEQAAPLVEAEAEARADADTALANSISSEASTRSYAVTALQQSIAGAITLANNANTAAGNAATAAANAQSTANSATTTANAAVATITFAQTASGVSIVFKNAQNVQVASFTIAPADEDEAGLMTPQQVEELASVLSTVEVLMTSTSELDDKAKAHDTVRFDAFVDDATLSQSYADILGEHLEEALAAASIVYIIEKGIFAHLVPATLGYYSSDLYIKYSASLRGFDYMDAGADLYTGKIYLCQGKAYCVVEGELVMIGSDIDLTMLGRGFQNAVRVLAKMESVTLEQTGYTGKAEGVVIVTGNNSLCWRVYTGGQQIPPEQRTYKYYSVTSIDGDISSLKELGRAFIYNNEVWMWLSSGIKRIDMSLGETANDAFPGNRGKELEEAMENFSAVGQVLNLTVQYPLTAGLYYKLIDTVAQSRSALHVALASGKATAGMMISFEKAKGNWKTYQYIGSTIEQLDFLNTENWKDFGSLAAGSESYIIINNLPGQRASGKSYDDNYELTTALDALAEYENTSGSSYQKQGAIIAYRTGEATMETKQFKGKVTDFYTPDFWGDFGGGTVETSDDPEEDGKDAFSTGGAYSHIPVQMAADTETEGVVKLSMVNAKGEAVGDEVMFQVGTGGGGGGSSLNFAIKNASNFCAAGSEYLLKIEVDTDDEVDQIIIDDHNNDKTQILSMLNPIPVGGYYYVDVSQFLTTSRTFKFGISVVCGSLSLRKTYTVTAVDVTIQSVQTLNYTADTVLHVGGGLTTLNMFRYPNAAVSNVKSVVEVYIDGEWQTLSETIVKTPATQSPMINPSDLFGDGEVQLEHGILPIRVHGEHEASGVVSQYLYTSVFVIDEESEDTLIAFRWYSNGEDAVVRLLDTMSVDVAIYDPTKTIGEADIYLINEKENDYKTLLRSMSADRSSTYTITHRIENVDTDGSVFLQIVGESENGQDTPVPCRMQVVGSVIDIELSPAVVLNMDMTHRSNSDADKTIKSTFVNPSGVTEVYELLVEGSNYSSNGFVKDNYGTSEQKGRMSLRIAEDVTAALDYPLFKNTSVESNGMCMQMGFKIKSVLDNSQVVFKCFDGTVGFYVTGSSIIFTTVGADPTEAASTDSTSIRGNFTQGEQVILGLVFEPVDNAPLQGTGIVKMYINGELAGSCYYRTGQSATYSEAEWEFDGTQADLYIYGIKAWRTFTGDYQQCFKNYLLDLDDTSTMVEEFNENDYVMETQSVIHEPVIPSEKVHIESGDKLRPQASALLNIGVPYVIITANAEAIADGYTFADEENGGNFPSWLDSRKEKKSTIYIDVYAYFPERPWQNFKAVKVPTTNQGTTSCQRPIKNLKMKFKKCKSMELIHARADFEGNAEALANYDECAANISKKKFQVYDKSIPTNILTLKVDYSESGGAHNGASTELMNLLTQALGDDYKTPSQKAYTGKYTMNPAIDSCTAALFRTDTTDPNNAYFHAKCNFNQDKGDAAVFGFEGVQGYNKNCLNYGDFIEHVVTTEEDGVNKGTLLASRAAQYVASHYTEMDASKPHMFSEFCGPNIKFYRDNGEGEFEEVSAVDNAAETIMTLAEMNAVEDKAAEFDLSLTYITQDGKFVHYISAGFTDTTGSFSFSSVTGTWVTEGDVLNPVECYEILTYVDMAWMRGVSEPGDMLNYGPNENETWMKYFESRYPDDDDLNALYESGAKVPYQLYRWLEFCNRADYETGDQQLWKTDLYQYANVKSIQMYHIFTDYLLAVDQRSKNMMLSFYKYEDGLVKASFQHLYDGDTIWTSDNDCGQTVPVDCDPNSQEGEVFYAGYGSIIFKNTAAVTEINLNSDGSQTSKLNDVLTAMRTAQINGITPFSASGCEYLWFTKRLKKWPKLVSSFDQERKYLYPMAYDTTYLYAMHGLGLHSLPEVFKERFAIRDGYYAGPSYLNDFVAMRGTVAGHAENISIGIKAARAGYFTIGVEGADASRRMTPVYLTPDDPMHYFETPISTPSVGGSQMYIIGASNVAEVDISSGTWTNFGELQKFTSLKRLVIGGEDYVEQPILAGAAATTLDFSKDSMPYMQEIDVRNTSIATVAAAMCPRLKSILASGSKLASFSLAEASRIETFEMPTTVTAMQFMGLQRLKYLGLSAETGIKVSSLPKITSIRVEGSPQVDCEKLVRDILASQTGELVFIRVRIVNDEISGRGSELVSIVENGIKGIASNGAYQDTPVVQCEYKLQYLLTDDQVDEIEDSIEGITLVIEVEAYTNFINDEINAEGYGGDAEVQTVTLDNIDTLALTYYNGESYDDYVEDFIEGNNF